MIERKQGEGGKREQSEWRKMDENKREGGKVSDRGAG